MRWLALAVALLAWPVAAVTCRDVAYQDTSFTACTVDLATEDLRLFLYGSDNQPLGHFSAVDQVLAPTGQSLAFAMNAGMYHSDRSPVGHYVENGRELMRVVPNAGPGNFGLLPNGVFCIRPRRADVIETHTFVRQKPACTYASQSGPMLVIDGKLHPRFLPDSDSRYIRNGVGTSADGKTAIFAISNSSVNFYTFAGLFRDVLKTPNALYFDGNISRLYAPDLGRFDLGFTLGPIVGVVVDKP